MDDQRFDRLVAALAADPSRRGVLIAFAGGGLAALLGLPDPDSTSARKRGKRKKKKGCKRSQKKCGRRCIPKADCCTAADCDEGDACLDGRCGNCSAAGDCPEPPVCRRAACAEGRCGTELLPAGSPCDDGRFCTVGTACTAEGECRGGDPRDCDDGFACTGDACDDDSGACTHEPSDAACATTNPCRSGRCDPSHPESDDDGCVFDNLTGGFTVCGVGACERTVDRCVDGVLQECVPGQPSPETCNGIDDDCDGIVDEGACPVDAPSTCGNNGVCAEGNCQKYGTTTVCQPASCVGTTLQPAARCDGNGSCVPPPTQSCAPYKCHSTVAACIGSCGGDGDCVDDHFCGGGVCRPDKGNGEPCQFKSQCASAFCDNGTCRPKRANGEGCANEGQCASNICVANVCCATFCNLGQTCSGGTCQG